ncbi:MAG: DUF2795 domain-containing protein [Pedococcus sp.]
MTAPPAHMSPQHQEWSDELAAFLRPACFPATHDHLAATLIQRHAPSQLLWHLSALPRARQFASLDEVIEHLGRAAPQAPTGSGTERH